MVISPYLRQTPLEAVMADPILIRPSDVSPPPTNAVALVSPELLTALIRNPERALGLLAEEVAPVQIDEISVDRLGRVVINNAEFARAMSEKQAGFDPRVAGTNSVCGLGC
jgi:hypothetical protein